MRTSGKALPQSDVVLSSIQWHETNNAMPDTDLVVLIYVPSSDSEQVWLGFHDGEDWRYVEGPLVESDVELWAEIPHPNN